MESVVSAFIVAIAFLTFAALVAALPGAAILYSQALVVFLARKFDNVAVGSAALRFLLLSYVVFLFWCVRLDQGELGNDPASGMAANVIPLAALIALGFGVWLHRRATRELKDAA
ncbi:hypothetical protein VQ045_06745 [Aurantimonas sp. E1-2-R+4]|uniref:hypothetical protein n=1 Tax=Aurantimonas sp. E1-2-R+4 TaxID=3113714 RepID=UPI002F95AAAD